MLIALHARKLPSEAEAYSWPYSEWAAGVIYDS